MSNFPPLRLAVLTGLIEIKAGLDKDPTYLDAAPYDAEAIAALKRMFAPTVIEKIVEKEIRVEAKAGRGRPTKEVQLTSEDQEKVRSEIMKLLDELNTLGTGDGLETSEQIQIVKTKSSLVKQLLEMQEKVFNIKRMAEFQETVIGILQDVVLEEGRDIFLKRINQFR